MKVLLCTLAICLSVLISTLTLSDAVRAEARKTRSAIPKALTEPLEPNVRNESVLQKLDALDVQLANLNRRVAALETSAPASPRGSVRSDAADETQKDLRALQQSVGSLSARLSRMDGVPTHLAELTTYLDRSFDHLEKTVADAAGPQQDLQTPLAQMADKIDALDGYFTPLYLFLGLPSDPATQDLLTSYPSLDRRIDDLAEQLEAVRKDVAAIKSQFYFPASAKNDASR